MNPKHSNDGSRPSSGEGGVGGGGGERAGSGYKQKMVNCYRKGKVVNRLRKHKTVSCCRKDKAVNCCYKHKTVNGYRKFQVVNPCRKHIPVKCYRKCKIANRCPKYRLGDLCYRRSINYCACLNQRAGVSVNCQGNRSYTPTQQLPRRANQPKLRIMLVYIPILSRHTL